MEACGLEDLHGGDRIDVRNLESGMLLGFAYSGELINANILFYDDAAGMVTRVSYVVLGLWLIALWEGVIVEVAVGVGLFLVRSVFYISTLCW